MQNRLLSWYSASNRSRHSKRIQIYTRRGKCDSNKVWGMSLAEACLPSIQHKYIVDGRSTAKDLTHYFLVNCWNWGTCTHSKKLHAAFFLCMVCGLLFHLQYACLVPQLPSLVFSQPIHTALPHSIPNIKLFPSQANHLLLYLMFSIAFDSDGDAVHWG